MHELTLLVIAGLMLKHFVADYLLQFRWMIGGKGSFSSPGGYVHAAIHAFGSAIVLWLAAVATPLLVALIGVEFIIHYSLDYVKVHFSKDVVSSERPHLFWALNGLDQLMHNLTYVGMTYVVISSVAV